MGDLIGWTLAGVDRVDHGMDTERLILRFTHPESPNTKWVKIEADIDETLFVQRRVAAEIKWETVYE